MDKCLKTVENPFEIVDNLNENRVESRSAVENDPKTVDRRGKKSENLSITVLNVGTIAGKAEDNMLFNRPDAAFSVDNRLKTVDKCACSCG